MRRWHRELLARLQSVGHSVALVGAPGGAGQGAALDRILRLEGSRSAHSLAHRDPVPAPSPIDGPDLVIDLTGHNPGNGVPTLTLGLNGQADLGAGLAAVLADGLRPELVAWRAGAIAGIARPMLGDRVWLGRIANDILAAAVTLIESATHSPTTDERPEFAVRPPQSLTARYVPHLFTGLGQRAIMRLTTRRPFYWRTAYRLIDGPGIAETGSIDGAAFTELGDNGQRFYADPFAFDHRGKLYLFVEDFPYALGRGFISVAELAPDGTFETPRPVIEEPHHLSYPQVFAHDGEVYMIPESSGASELVLYRAEQFPHHWVREAVLVSGRKLNDMTLLIRDDRFWLVGTEQIGQGSASDTMVAWSSRALSGPWTPHPLNPIRIDRAAARPGGRFVERDGRTFLPVQDGTLAYGGGLGFIELLELSDTAVRFGPLRPIEQGAAWPGHGIHTLDRAGRLEVIDSAS